ncbi:S8 family serine peptidase [Streptomyces fulvoviolaceus]|uniref:S8 family serine peptidase n=1 Tax=Streptomyces fulvoviolaceus TaxID=285535 RepID=UPI000A594D6D|nr:S8 family serine peptidase [Streptomyces fulvoviolaceus]
MLGALAVAMVCAASVPAPAVAASPSPASPSPTSSAGGDSTSLPSIPLALADDAPCTAASDRTARYATWAQQSLSLSHAWQLSRGEGVTVAVVDTGVSATAPTLSGRVTAVGDAGEDCVGHGTFTAGLVAAAPTSGTAFRGVAPAGRVLAVRGTDRRGTASAGLVADGIRAAVDRGAEVIAVALALTTGEDELTAAVRYATSHDALVVAAAAPDVEPKSTDTPVGAYWPASAPGALSVVGVLADGSVLASASGATGADLAAPGGPVVGIGPRGSGHYIGAGSSSAAAFAAGTAALVRAYHPELTAAETAERLTASAAPTGDAPRLDPYAALSMVPAGSRSPAAPSPATPLHLPAVSTTPRHRALLAAGAMAGLVLVVAAAAVVIPRGRARGWRPPP